MPFLSVFLTRKQKYMNEALLCMYVLYRLHMINMTHPFNKRMQRSEKKRGLKGYNVQNTFTLSHCQSSISLSVILYEESVERQVHCLGGAQISITLSKHLSIFLRQQPSISQLYFIIHIFI